MHPASLFRWEDRDAMRRFVRDIAFGQLFAQTPDGPRVAQVPAVWIDDDTIAVHVSRGNDVARHVDGLTAVFAVLGPDGYISPDWYGLPDQVPTWNYSAVELEGVVRRLDRDATIAQIDALTAEQEARFDKPAWTRAKMSPGAFDRIVVGTVGFALTVTAWRGTLKLGQHKPAAARDAVTAACEAAGQHALAQAMRDLP